VVGIGIGLLPQYLPNLAEVTGPTANDDYYQTGTTADGLLDKLYDIASKTCGIPVAALPQPQGADLPVMMIVGGVIAAALLAAIAGYFFSRRRSGDAPAVAPRKSGAIANPTIGWDEIPAVPANIAQAQPPPTTVGSPDPPQAPPPELESPGPSRMSRGPKRISTARYQSMSGQRPSDQNDDP